MSDKRKRAEESAEDEAPSGWHRPQDEAATDEAATDEAATDESAADEAATDEAATDEAGAVEQAEDDQVASLMEEAADLKERLLRTMADMENLRKRTEREKAEASLYAATSFARDLLSVADSLDRALQSTPEEGRDTLDEATRNLLAGIEVTHKEFLNVFSRHGIVRLEPIGAKFDPHFHQAMFEVPDASSPPGTVVQVMQAGYTIGERCLRPALVGVAKAPPAASDGGEAHN